MYKISVEWEGQRLIKSMSTHTEIWKIGEATAIVSGVPDRCKHAFNGWGFMLGNGEFLPEVKFRCSTDEATQEYVEFIAKERNTYVSGGGSCCSICGKQEFSFYDLMRME